MQLVSITSAIFASLIGNSFLECINFEEQHFGHQNASVFVIEAHGRLGNHIIAYSVIRSLEKTLGVQGFVTEQTKGYLDKFFELEHLRIKTLEHHFCNFQDMKFEVFDGRLDSLLSNKDLLIGNMVNLWPKGYQVKMETCCSAMELIKHVEDNYLTDLRQELEFKRGLKTAAKEKMEQVAESMNLPLESITFVGIHDRRTVKF